MGRRFVTEIEELLARLHRMSGEKLHQSRFSAPKRGRLDARRRRHVLANDFEQLADEAFRRPVGETDASALAGHAREFGRRLHLVGREHHAEGGQHHVETAVRERQILGVGFLKMNR